MSRHRYALPIALLLSVQLLSCGGGGDSGATNCAQVLGVWTVTDSATITCSGSFGSGTQTQTGTGTIQITQIGCNVSFLTPAPANLARSGTVTANTMQMSGPLAPGSAGVTFTQNGIAFSGSISPDGRTINLTGTVWFLEPSWVSLDRAPQPRLKLSHASGHRLRQSRVPASPPNPRRGPARAATELTHYVAAFKSSPLGRWQDRAPWELTAQSCEIVRQLLSSLPEHEFAVSEAVAVHRTAIVESGAILKAPLILGAGCFVAAGAYLRGGNWVDAHCTLGPGVELKSSFVFAGTKLAHFNFVGDSIIGSAVNLEAGSIVCNHRNERVAKEILVRLGGELHATGCDKFGAVLGDNCRIGANAVIAPGALLVPGTIVRRAQLCDQELAPPQPGV